MLSIIFGLDSFGASISKKLFLLGHQVIGVERANGRNEFQKSNFEVRYFDFDNMEDIQSLPLSEADFVIVAIEKNVEASIMTAALMRKHKVKRLICRAISPLHEKVLSAIGVHEIIHPEEESAEQWSTKLNFPRIKESIHIIRNLFIIYLELPSTLEGKTVKDLNLELNYNVLLLSICKKGEETELKKRNNFTKELLWARETILSKNDLLVLFGEKENINRFLRINM